MVAPVQPGPSGQDDETGQILAPTGMLVRRPPNGSLTRTVQLTLLLALIGCRTIDVFDSESDSRDSARTFVVVVVGNVVVGATVARVVVVGSLASISDGEGAVVVVDLFRLTRQVNTWLEGSRLQASTAAFPLATTAGAVDVDVDPVPEIFPEIEFQSNDPYLREGKDLAPPAISRPPLRLNE